MAFSSPRFLIFLVLLLLVLHLVPDRETKKRVLALASCLFYAAWDWRYLGLLLLVSAIDYTAAWKIYQSESSKVRRFWLWTSLGSNLGILSYFKYTNFFLENSAGLLREFGFDAPVLHLVLPAGISFYTFKAMSYTIDVYRRELTPCSSWLDYATFMTFFPELIAGPIVRASVFLPQLAREIGPTVYRIKEGFSLFLLGLVKKLLVADQMAVIADAVFNSPGVWSSLTVWCGLLAYGLQIYCDFSGYSDMAIGTAKMIGYDLPENFNMPYVAASITEFWRRWHMTLSQWLRDYLYIPLGGNRGTQLQTYRNLTVTMLLGGLWHGASWNFVLWGGLHGIALVLHKLWVEATKGRKIIPHWGGLLLTLTFVTLCWVPFRSTSWESTKVIFGKLFFVGNAQGIEWYPTWLGIYGAMALAAHVIGVRIISSRRGSLEAKPLGGICEMLGCVLVGNAMTGLWISFRKVTVAGVFVIALIMLLVFLLAPMNSNPFIYFQF